MSTEPNGKSLVRAAFKQNPLPFSGSDNEERRRCVTIMGKDLCQAEEEEEHNGRFESWESQADIRIMDYNGNRIRGTKKRESQ